MANTYLTRTEANFGTATNRKKCTISFWLKRSSLTVQQAVMGVETTPAGGSNEARIILKGDDKLEIYDYQSGYKFRYITNRLFRDTSAWYNFVIKIDTSQANVSHRLRIYVNGQEETSFTTETNPDLNLDTFLNSGAYVQIGRQSTGNSYLNGSLSHFHFIDGEDRGPEYFGETDANGVWKIKTSLTGVNYGTNGFFILKDGNSVTDQSGNSNNFTVSGGTLTNTLDCPDNVFATLNPLAQTFSGITYSSGNTISTMTGDVGQRQSISTLGMPSGKFYMECKLQAIGSTGGSYPYVGIVAQEKYDADTYIGGNGCGWHPTGDIYNGASNSPSGSTYTTGDIIGVAVDIDNSKLYWHKNGTYILSGNPSTGANGYDISARTAEGTLGFGVSSWNNNGIWQANFGNGYFGTTAVSSAGTNASGNGIFEFDVPTGYTALSTKGLNL